MLQLKAHNALFTAGAETYFLKVNQFADRSLEEISADYTGLGQFSSAPAALGPSQVSRGQLPVNPGAPKAVDTEQDCRTPVTEEQQQLSQPLSGTLRHRYDLRFGFMRNALNCV